MERRVVILGREELRDTRVVTRGGNERGVIGD